MNPMSLREWWSLRLSALLIVTGIFLTSCESNDKTTNQNELTSLNQLAEQGADSQPVDDGLDQVQADLLVKFGSANSTPFPVTDRDTVKTLLTRQ